MIKNKFLSRKTRLTNRINAELKVKEPNLTNILDAVDSYEKDNVATIDKFKRAKKVEMTRITGALRQTIESHGVITKPLIGSAAKRIYGALLTNEKPTYHLKMSVPIEGSTFKIHIKQVILSLIIGLLIGLFI